MKINQNNCKKYAVVFDGSVSDYAEAAADLVKYLQEVCSITLGDRGNAENFICIGENEVSKPVIDAYDTSNFKYDEFRILPKDGNVYIFGGSSRAAKYGTYELIERYLGVKWLNIDGTVVPKKEEMLLPTEEIACKPYFNQRQFLMMQTMLSRFNTQEEVDSIKNHLRFATHKWCNTNSTDHNSIHYVPKDKYLESHPEFYYKSPQSGGIDLCMTNGITDDGDLDESMEISCAKVAADSLYNFIKSQPDAKFCMFGRQDDRTTVCQCERCVKAREKYGNEAGVDIVFLKAIMKKAKERLRAEGLNDDFGMVTFAYQSTVNPPVVNGTEPIHPNVIPGKDLYIRYAPIDADYTYPMLDERQKPDVRSQLIGWMSLTNNIMIWDYCCNFTEYVWFFPNMWYFKDNLALYAKSNFEYVFNQGSYSINREWQGEMKAYIASKLYWNMDLDVRELTEEYVRGYYGMAADKVLQLIDDMNDYYAKKVEEGLKVLIIGVYGEYFNPETYDRDFLVRNVELMESAIQDVLNSDLSDEEKEIMKIRLYRVLMTPLRMLSRNESTYFPNGDTDYGKRFLEVAVATGLTKLGEGSPLFTEMTKDGEPIYKIILGQEPTEKEVEAANYLQQCLQEKTGLTFPIAKDDTVYPYFGEKAVCIGKGMMFREFFKGTVDIEKYEYFIELCGKCAFIHAAEDGNLKKGVDLFVDVLMLEEQEGVKVLNLPYVRKRKEK